MNVKFLGNEVFCTGCGKSLGTGYQVKNRKYCTNHCQADHKKRMVVEDWLQTGICRNTVRPQISIREFLTREQHNCCAICNRVFLWEEKKLVPIVDHIDGNASNGGRPNLRLVCPNCDSQLPTYKGRNKGNGRRKRMERYHGGKSY